MRAEFSQRIDSVEAKLSQRIDLVEANLARRIDAVDARIDALQRLMVQFGGALTLTTLATLVSVILTRA